MQRLKLHFVFSAGVVLLGLISVAVAHGHDGENGMDMDMSASSIPRPTILSSTVAADPKTYFHYGGGLLSAHIFLMTIGWAFVLPIGVMLSIVRSRFTLPIQFVFLAINAVGVFLITIYNASTPDLYPNNAHHKIGWLLTWMVSAQVVMGIICAYAGRKKENERGMFMPVSTEAIAEHLRLHERRQDAVYRFSNDSGQGTEPNTESLRSQSISSISSNLPNVRQEHEDAENEDEEKYGLMGRNSMDSYLKSKIPGLLSSKILQVLRFVYLAIDRLILMLGFLGIVTGLVTYGGFFMGDRIFSGLAHHIKGGIFMWYGILTLGRWAGCFADIGWAWNIKRLKSRAPTAEFVESFLIFFYGSTNVFLEHLNAWGKAWSAQDLEHISITVMFFGGGLCGMLIESRRIRDMLNGTRHDQQEATGLEEPKSYPFSMNPLPALIVLLLGLMMSSHHQDSMVSTMIHKQWGNLLVGAAFSRATTYIIFYLSPPTSRLPGRPPTELITAFCLMAGGMIFMASARDTTMAMESKGLDAMFMFTVSMGVITFSMAWIITVIAIKGAAARKENRMTDHEVA